MASIIDSLLAATITLFLVTGTGYTIKEVHDFVKKETLEQISQGLSSSEELANALTDEKLDF